MTLLGTLALWLALLVGVWGTLAGLVGGLRARPDLQQSARHAVFVMCGALLVAVFSLEVALFRHDFNVEYVAAYTSRNLPIFYTWSALYAGQKGSLLFWATVLSVFGSLALVLTPRRQRELLPYVAAVVSRVAAFFIAVMLFGGANPFLRLPYTPVDGSGLNPQLQNPGMVFHPPMLYLGYISITIPFAFAMAALLSKRLDTDWLVAIRKWTLLSWLFLSIGICLGMWWAYVELGWGGYWAWDPVENASLLPWLTMTAFLHSVMIQEKRGMLKKWNLALIIGSWLLSIFGTFITRSGVISSVHSFTQSNVGYFFLFFLLVAGTASFTLYATRLPLLTAQARLAVARPHGHRPPDRVAPRVAPDPAAPVRRSGARGRVHGPRPARGGDARRLRPRRDGARRLRGRHDRAGVRARHQRAPPPVRRAVPPGVGPPHRAQPAALRRLRRAYRHRDAVRGLQLDGLQDRDRGDAPAGRVGIAARALRLHLHLHSPRHLAVRRAEPPRHRGGGGGTPRRQADRDAEPREAPARGLVRPPDVPAFHRAQHHEPAARRSVRRAGRRGQRHRGGGVPLHDQPARVVGVVRWDDRRAGRPGRDVAGRGGLPGCQTVASWIRGALGGGEVTTDRRIAGWADSADRKSTRLNSSHLVISYAVFCLKKKNTHTTKARIDDSLSP